MFVSVNIIHLAIIVKFALEDFMEMHWKAILSLAKSADVLKVCLITDINLCNLEFLGGPCVLLNDGDKSFF